MLGSMDPWITVAELAVWVREPIPPGDEFAQMVIKAATIKVSDACDMATPFHAGNAPDSLRVIVGQVAKRAYKNPDQIVQDGSIGPIGGDRYAQAYAAGLSLTEEEEAEVQRIARRSSGRTGKGIKILGFRVPHHGTYGRTGTYVPDRPAPGLGFSAGSDWQVPID